MDCGLARDHDDYAVYDAPKIRASLSLRYY
jgi:hypothetical protein